MALNMHPTDFNSLMKWLEKGAVHQKGDETRPVLTRGQVFNQDGQALTITANGYSMHVVDIAVPATDNGSVVFKNTLAGVTDHQFPDAPKFANDLIAKPHHVFAVKHEALVKTLKAVHQFSEKHGYNGIRLTISRNEDGKCTLVVSRPTAPLGAISVTLPAFGHNGEARELQVDYLLLQRAVEHLLVDQSGHITLGFAEDGEVLYVLSNYGSISQTAFVMTLKKD